MKKIVFIVNPNSGNGYGASIGKKIEAVRKHSDIEMDIRYTEKVMDATRMASEYTKADDVLLVSVGGDGTLNEVLNGLHAGVPLAIIPSGSGNDFYRLIDPMISDMTTLINETINGSIQYVDYGIVNGKKFIGSFSVGLDADIVYKAREIQKSHPRVRKSAYVRALIDEMRHPQKFHVIFEDDKTSVEKDALIVSCLNGRYYGGGFNPAPTSDFQDGLVDINIVDFIKMGRILTLVPKYMKGKHYGAKEVTFVRSHRFTITCDKEMVAQVDGELFKATTFDIEVVNKGLPLMVARGGKDHAVKE